MLFLDILPFDLLEGSASPFEGADASLSNIAQPRFLEVVSQARSRAKESFEVDVPANLQSADCLERIAVEMWNEGWDPTVGDVALFVRDFGALLAHGIATELNGELVFRSPTNLSHISVWWPLHHIESFPFHKMYKRMTNVDGESLTYYVRSLSRRVRAEESK